MSEQNILNPAVNSPFNPDYGYTEDLPSTVMSWKPRFGPPYSRVVVDGGRQIQLEWSRAALSTKQELQRWSAQYEQGYFTYADWEAGPRYYTGRFTGPPQCVPTGNNNYDIKATFMELPGLPMYAFPNYWGRDSIFIHGNDDFGRPVARIIGAWMLGGTANYPSLGQGGYDVYSSAVTDDTVEWQYYGYGFRLWSPTGPDAGIVEVSFDGVVAVSLDLYSAAVAPSANRFESGGMLGVHRIKLRVTGTKNAASSSNLVLADTIEIMR